MSKMNLDEFANAGYDQWLQLVKKELGERSVDTLQWEVEEGIEVGPYSTTASHDYSLSFVPSVEQYQLISHTDVKEWNRIALESLMGGTNALGMDCASLSPGSLEQLLNGIEVAYISIHFVNMKDAHAWASAFASYCNTHSIDCTQLNGSFEMSNADTSVEEMKAWLAQSRATFPRFRVLTVDVVKVHEQGGSSVQELSWALTAGHALLVACMEAGSGIDEASACLQFNFATGSSYFPQIAKLRAFRWMWKQIIDAYKPEHTCSVHTFVHASTSRYLQTAKDKHNNLLRATTQAMSAYVGGANSVSVFPYNAWSEASDESALRWSRNIQQILLEESYFGQFKAAADGAYFIEALTAQFIQAAWKHFQHLDAKASAQGIGQVWSEHQHAIQAHAARQLERVKEGKRVIVGVNKYVNKTDSAVVDERAHTLSAPLEKA
jgi:methylmalonyl-CoA mutase